MLVKKLIHIMMVLASFALLAGAQNQPAKTIQNVPMKHTSPASGKEMYTNYCAVCHGTDGKGNGPAVTALKVPPADLTVLAKNNGGKYPALKVASAIRGDSDVPAHGTREMPMWGELFRSLGNGHDAEVDQRVVNLDKYIESLQAK